MQSKRLLEKEEHYDRAELRLNETLFSNANGYIGVRGTLEEGVPSNISTMRGMYLGGVYEIIPMKQAESLCNLIEKKQTMLNVADTQTIFMDVNKERFDLSTGNVILNKRILDMENGYTKREISWQNSAGETVDIGIKRMAHFDKPWLFTIEYKVTARDFSGEIAFDSWHIADVKNYSDPDDPRLAAESESYLTVVDHEVYDSSSVCVSKTGTSGIEVASAVGHIVKAPAGREVSETSDVKEGNRIVRNYRIPIEKGETVTLIKYTTFSDSLRNSDPKSDAQEKLASSMNEDITKLYERQSDILSEFWKSCGMEIEGDDDLNLAMSFNMYELFCSAPRLKGSSIAAKGLTGEGYEGHYFWDTEMYALPFFALTDENCAKNILNYRFETLGKAMENAKLLGHKKGALYPWRTITGEECSGYFPSGSAAYHINGAVAYAVVRYYLTSGDDEYMKSEGAQILLETSRLWMDVGHMDRDGRFVINEVTGPDEYTCMVDNNYYTNCVAAYGLKQTVKIFEKFPELTEKYEVSAEELSLMQEAADKMYLPYDERLGINPQDDSFLQKPVWDIENTPKEEFPLLLHYHPLHLYRYQVCKQADTVLSHFLFPDMQSKETMEKSYRYYEKITTHDSSLSTCVFSMQASRLGLYEEAQKYFGDSAKLDLLNLHGNSGDGVHTANMGGAYMAIVNGFAGVDITDEGLSIDPFLPESLSAYSFNFKYRGRIIRIRVKSDRTEITLVEGEGTEFYMDHNKNHINTGETKVFNR